jgi:hypothetical protein
MIIRHTAPWCPSNHLSQIHFSTKLLTDQLPYFLMSIPPPMFQVFRALIVVAVWEEWTRWREGVEKESTRVQLPCLGSSCSYRIKAITPCTTRKQARTQARTCKQSESQTPVQTQTQTLIQTKTQTCSYGIACNLIANSLDSITHLKLPLNLDLQLLINLLLHHDLLSHLFRFSL